MARWEDHKDILGTIRDEWDKAEVAIKLAEQVNSRVVFPSIKELRYGGRRIIEMLWLIGTDAPKEEVQKYLQDALFDCYRARHDAIDAVTAKISLDINTMIERLGYEAILPVFPSLPALLTELNSICQRIALSRADRHNRDAIYGAIEKADVPALVATYRSLMANEGMIRAIARRRDREATFQRLGLIALVVIGLAALLITIVHH